MGTRSSMPWNSAEKSSSAGSSNGEKPKQRMPSVDSALASVPPLIRYGIGMPVRVLGLERRAHRVHERAVESWSRERCRG